MPSPKASPTRRKYI